MINSSPHHPPRRWSGRTGREVGEREDEERDEEEECYVQRPHKMVLFHKLYCEKKQASADLANYTLFYLIFFGWGGGGEGQRI